MFTQTTEDKVHEMQRMKDEIGDKTLGVMERLKEVHRKKFNLEAFGTTFETNDVPKDTMKTRRKVMTKETYQEYWRLLKYWNVTEGFTDPETGVHVTQAEFKKLCRPSWYTQRLLHRLAEVNVPGEEAPVQHLQHYDAKKDTWRVMLHKVMVFDAIYAIHVAVGHKKTKVTWNTAAETYHSLTEDLCGIFVETCPTCKNKGGYCNSDEQSTVRNGGFREIITACFVDYSTMPIIDLTGSVMRYILALQDKATGFTVLRPIRSKKRCHWIYELSYMFAILGYPKKNFGSTEGSEFQKTFMRELIKEWEPGCEHESEDVQHINSLVKTTIEQLHTEKKIEKEKMVLLKGSRGYEDSDSDDSVKYMHLGNGVEDEDDENADERINWVHLAPLAMMRINETAYPQVYGMELSSRGISDLGEEAKLGRESVENDSLVVDLLDMDHSVQSVLDNQQDAAGSKMSGMVIDNRASASINQGSAMIYPKLHCQQCEELTGIGSGIVTIATDESYYDSLAKGTVWWPADIAAAFGFLKAHENHGGRRIFVNALTPSETRYHKRSNGLTLPESVQSILTIALKDSHFVVLEIKLKPACTTVVYDGKYKGNAELLKRWEVHQDYILARCGIQKEKKWLMRYHDRTKDFPFGCVLDICQKDDCNCGPVACRVLWELLVPGEVDEKYGERGTGLKDRKRVKGGVSEWRNVCVKEMKKMLKLHSSKLTLQGKRKREEYNKEKIVTI